MVVYTTNFRTSHDLSFLVLITVFLLKPTFQASGQGTHHNHPRGEDEFRGNLYRDKNK